jgi:hypothetical protein
MLTIVTILIIAAVVAYIIRSVKPKRVKARACVLKILTLDFETDGGSQVMRMANLDVESTTTSFRPARGCERAWSRSRKIPRTQVAACLSSQRVMFSSCCPKPLNSPPAPTIDYRPRYE